MERRGRKERMKAIGKREVGRGGVEEEEELYRWRRKLVMIRRDEMMIN